jgi:hypothetical protein
MSERGSFVTEYVYCGKCFEAAKSVLLGRHKGLCSVVVPHWNLEHEGPEMPIIAGKVGGLGAGDELLAFEFGLNAEIAKVLCHPMRIAVLAESGERVFTVTPNVQDEAPSTARTKPGETR